MATQQTQSQPTGAVLAHLRRIFAEHVVTVTNTNTDVDANADNSSVTPWTAAQTVTFHSHVQHEQPPASASTTDLAAFLTYMFSPAGDVMAPPPPADTDPSFPLASYFISSSHNTYLTGNQVSGSASAQAYRDVLSRGCRCIEADVWDGDDHDDDGEPRVLHGHTLTRQVSFAAVCAAVRDAAFTTTDMPLVVSLEVHCGPEQQDRMARIMRDTWAGLLLPDADVEANAHGVPGERTRGKLPAPRDLRNTILVKVKHVPAEGEDGDEDGDGDESEDEAEDEKKKNNNNNKKKKKKKPKHSITPALGSLAVYTRAVRFRCLSSPEARMPGHVFSLSESAVAAQPRADLARHNQRFLMRAYPSGLGRVGSSNPDPAACWAAGVHMVALNWQRCDAGLMLNEAMFSGTAGWVLKPAGLRGTSGEEEGEEEENDDDHNDNDQNDHGTETVIDLTMQVHVLAAQNLPLPDDDDDDDDDDENAARDFRPYVKISLHGVGATTGHHKPKARTRAARGTHPDFGGQVLSMTMTMTNTTMTMSTARELAFVRFTVRDDEPLARDDVAAWACVRLPRLREGYRLVRLRDMKGRLTNGLVLVLVKVKWASR